MKITDIIPDFSTLSQAELEAVIRGVRRSRTTKKEVSLSKRPTKVKETIKKTAKASLDGVSPEQLEMLKKLFA